MEKHDERWVDALIDHCFNRFFDEPPFSMGAPIVSPIVRQLFPADLLFG